VKRCGHVFLKINKNTGNIQTTDLSWWFDTFRYLGINNGGRGFSGRGFIGLFIITVPLSLG
jgi:hypothetical protein